MKSKIAKRVGRIISGSFYAMVDALEGSTPEIVMDQSIREIDGVIDEVREELGRTVASKHIACRRLSQKNSEHEDLTCNIQTAFEESREDLAKAAVGRQLDIEAQIPVLEETITDCSEREKELEGYISALNAKKREMEEELHTFRSAKESGFTEQESIVSNPSSSIDKKINDATSAFDRVLSRFTKQKPGHFIGSECSAQLAELEELSRNNRIEERISRLKSSEK
jgi:phage shock protein A